MIGQIVNHYAIRSLIGQGAMGSVYLAEHSFIGRRAAIKVLRRAFADDGEVVARFMNEARAVNAIRHRNIIDIIDVGRLSDGLPYLLMEYLEGETLGQRLARLGRLSTTEAMAVIGPAASALGAAHDKGIVHRDLKPDNIFLAREPGSDADRVIVLDFGVAKLRGDLSSVSSGAALLGTPAYMSPEQCRGVGEIDARTDVYALGTILYQMLCGRVPFVSTGYGDVLIKHLLEPPVPPGSLVPEIPPPIEAMILRSLAKEPGDRFASMAEAWAALCSATPTPGPVPLSPAETTVTPGVSPPAARQPAAQAGQRPPRRSRFLPRALATTALLAVVGAWAWSRWQPDTGGRNAAGAAPFPLPASIEKVVEAPAAAEAPAPAETPAADEPSAEPAPAAEPIPAAAAEAVEAVEAPEPTLGPIAPGPGYRVRPLGPARGPRALRWSKSRMKMRDLPPVPWRREDRRSGKPMGREPMDDNPVGNPDAKPDAKRWMDKW